MTALVVIAPKCNTIIRSGVHYSIYFCYYYYFSSLCKSDVYIPLKREGEKLVRLMTGSRYTGSLTCYVCGAPKPMYCPTLQPEDQIRYSGGYQGDIGDVVMQSCDPGYGITRGKPRRVCEPNGMWSGAPIKCNRKRNKISISWS